jgi:glutathione S-transferase
MNYLKTGIEPILHNSIFLIKHHHHHHKGFIVRDKKYPNLLRWFEAMDKRPSYQGIDICIYLYVTVKSYHSLVDFPLAQLRYGYIHFYIYVYVYIFINVYLLRWFEAMDERPSYQGIILI